MISELHHSPQIVFFPLSRWLRLRMRPNDRVFSAWKMVNQFVVNGRVFARLDSEIIILLNIWARSL